MGDVVAALIWKEDTFLICRRPAHKALPLLWEFVGGKVEAGETYEEALIRECREELDITVAVREEVMRVVHRYPDFDVRLILFNTVIEEGVPRLLEHEDMRWITAEQIPYFDFCPADDEILKRLQAGTIRPQAQ
jgi:8-oxo-dGTP diphosphatase